MLDTGTSQLQLLLDEGPEVISQTLLCLSTLKSSRPVLTCNATPETARMTMSGGAGLKTQLSKQVIGAYCYFGGSMCLSCSGSGFLPRATLVYCAELKSV